MTCYFIYYRVASGSLRQLKPAVAKIQSAVRAATGIEGRLLRRDDATETWMETYEDVGDSIAFETALHRALAEVNFDALLADGAQRHVERFVDA
jgi:hypothetical protein